MANLRIFLDAYVNLTAPVKVVDCGYVIRKSKVNRCVGIYRKCFRTRGTLTVSAMEYSCLLLREFNFSIHADPSRLVVSSS
jgi:hypothetical protein